MSEYLPAEWDLLELQDELARVRREHEKALRGATLLRVRERALQQKIHEYHRLIETEDDSA